MLIAALAVGSFAGVESGLAPGDTNTPPSTPPAGAPPAGQPSRAGFERMVEQLNLTADQKPKVQSIMDTQRQKMPRFAQRHQPVAGRTATKRKIVVVRRNGQQMNAVLRRNNFDKWQKNVSHGTRRLHPMSASEQRKSRGTNGTRAPRNNNLWGDMLISGRPRARPFFFCVQRP